MNNPITCISTYCIHCSQTPTELQWTLQGMDDEVPKATEDAELTNTATHKITRLKHLLTVGQ